MLSLMLSIATPLLVKGLNKFTEEANAEVFGAAATTWAEWASNSAFQEIAYWLECLFLALSVAISAGVLLHAITLYACFAIYFTATFEVGEGGEGGSGQGDAAFSFALDARLPRPTHQTLSFLLNYGKELAKIGHRAINAIQCLMFGLLFLTARMSHATLIAMVVGIIIFVNILRGLLPWVTKLALDQVGEPFFPHTSNDF